MEKNYLGVIKHEGEFVAEYEKQIVNFLRKAFIRRNKDGYGEEQFVVDMAMVKQNGTVTRHHYSFKDDKNNYYVPDKFPCTYAGAKQLAEANKLTLICEPYAYGVFCANRSYILTGISGESNLTPENINYADKNYI